MATPRDFQKIVIAHKMKLDFGLALKELDLTLDKDSTMDNFKVFKDALKKAKMKSTMELLKRCEEEKMLDVFFRPQPIEEGEEYCFVSGGRKMFGEIVTCEACGKYCYVNGGSVKEFPKGVFPLKILEGIKEMAGYSEERERCECQDCSV